MKPLYHPMKLSTQSSRAVTSWKKNTLHFKSFSTKENLNKKPYNLLDYQQFQRTENQWSTFADFFKWYNDLDVTPIIQAIESMNEFYKNFIHQAISIPGVAIIMCFNSITDPPAKFHLFNPKNKDIYHLFKENIIRGPSIIFNRYYKSVKTFIEMIQTNHVRKSSAMMQMFFIFRP